MSRWVFKGGGSDSSDNGSQPQIGFAGGIDGNNAFFVAGAVYTWARLRIVVTSFAGSARTVNVRIQGTDTNPTVTINATGTFTDNTNTANNAVGDLVGVQNRVTGGTPMHGDNMTYNSLQVSCTSSGEDNAPWIATRSSTVGSPGANTYWPFSLLALISSTESDVETYFHTARTLSQLGVYCVTFDTNTVIRVRKNGANGNQNLTINASGTFRDTTNTDSFSATDVGCLHRENSGGTTAIYSSSVLTNSVQTMIPFDGESLGNTYLEAYWRTGATEADVETYVPLATTIHHLTAYCTSFTSSRTIRVRKNNANGSGTVTVNATGRFIDTTNTDSYAQDDQFNLSTSATGGATLWAHIEYFQEAVFPGEEEYDPRAFMNVQPRPINLLIAS